MLYILFGTDEDAKWVFVNNHEDAPTYQPSSRDQLLWCLDEADSDAVFGNEEVIFIFSIIENQYVQDILRYAKTPTVDWHFFLGDTAYRGWFPEEYWQHKGDLIEYRSRD